MTIRLRSMLWKGLLAVWGLTGWPPRIFAAAIFVVLAVAYGALAGLDWRERKQWASPSGLSVVDRARP